MIRQGEKGEHFVVARRHAEPAVEGGDPLRLRRRQKIFILIPEYDKIAVGKRGAKFPVLYQKGKRLGGYDLQLRAERGKLLFQPPRLIHDLFRLIIRVDERRALHDTPPANKKQYSTLRENTQAGGADRAARIRSFSGR